MRVDRRGLATAAAGLALLAVGVLVHRDDILAGPLHFDERIFVGAFEAVARGESPYSQPTFNYPPPFAVVGSGLWRALGPRPFLLLLRSLELAAVCAIAWIAVGLTAWRPWVRWLVAAGAIALAAPVEHALASGNVSPIIALLSLVGLLLAGSSPLLAGLVLGSALAFKPMAAAVPLVLAASGFGSPLPAGRRAAWRAAALAVAVAGGLCLVCGGRYLPEMLQRAAVTAPAEQDLSLSRGLRPLGLEPNPLLLFAGVSALAVVYVLRRRPAGRQLETVALAASVASLPVVWPHTFLLAFPIQALALERAGEAGSRRPLAVGLVIAAVLAIDGRSGSGIAPPGWSEAARGLLALVPLLALGLLVGIVLSRPATD